MLFLKNLKKNLSSYESRMHLIHRDRKFYVGSEVWRSLDQTIYCEDSTVSPKHAIIYIDNEISMLHIENTSKRCIFVDNEQIGDSVKINAIEGLVIGFGTQGCSYKLTYMPLDLSMTGEVDEDDVLKYIWLLCGQIKPSLHPDCSLLVSKKFDITLEVLQCLVSQKKIVTPAFLKGIFLFNNSKELPLAENFVPPCSLNGVVDEMFKPNEARKTLFCGKVFMFLEQKKLNTFKDLIGSSGGEAKLFRSHIVDFMNLSQNNFLAVSSSLIPEDYEVSFLKDVAESFLHSHQKRLIFENEICLSILYSSTKKYCNPDFSGSMESIVSSYLPTTSSTHSTIRFGDTFMFIPDVMPALKNNEISEKESRKESPPELSDICTLYGFKHVPKKKNRNANSPLMKVDYAKLVTRTVDNDGKDSPNFKKFKKVVHYKASEKQKKYTYFADCGTKET